MAGDHSPAKAAMFAVRTRMNHEAILYFSTCIASILIIFILLNLLRIITGRRPESTSPSFVLWLPRIVRSLALRKVPGFPSVGHGVVVSIYTTINLVIMLTHYDLANMPLLPNLAARTGWLAIANLVVVVLLSLKNTPLAFLTSWSYERLNPLHQVAGYATLIHVILHTACYCSYFVGAGRSSRLLYQEEIYGMVAGLSFLVLGVSGAVIRRWWYELFYYLHITFWMLGIVMVGLHQPEMTKKIIFATYACGAAWVCDRLLRLLRLAAYRVSNEVTVHPLPNNATRVVLKKPPLGAVLGKHCFLWIPAIRAVETHPFTIASSDPVEFVIRSHDGFTSDLHRYATENPGMALKASVDGAYGTFSKPRDNEEALLIAGGSGASFAFGAALDALESRSPATMGGNMTFIWLVKSCSQLTWYSNQIRTLKSYDRVSIRLYVTRPLVELVEEATNVLARTNSASSRRTDESTEQGEQSDDEKNLSDLENQTSIDPEDSESIIDDAPSPMEGMVRDIEGVAVLYQRPDVAASIRKTIEETRSDQRVLVLACGPDRLMKTVRNTTASCIRGEGPAVELHCEQFGW